MSIGNLKDSGNQNGNNFPFQLKVLQGLQQVIDNNNICCEALNELLQPRERKINVKSVSDSDTAGTNAFSLSIANVGTVAGLVNGVALPAGVTLNFDAGVLNNRLSGVIYDATGTKFLITTITD
jgi:hypothetical protein